VSPEVIGSPWQLAQAKRARKAAKFTRDMERTAEGRLDGRVWGFTDDGGEVRGKGADGRPPGYWDVAYIEDGFGSYYRAAPRWRQRLNRRRERGPIGKPWPQSVAQCLRVWGKRTTEQRMRAIARVNRAADAYRLREEAAR
jgi:hypothetical protein